MSRPPVSGGPGHPGRPDRPEPLAGPAAPAGGVAAGVDGPAAGVDGLAVGVDIGGTKVLAGLVDSAGTVLAKHREPTPSQDADAVAAAVQRAVEAVAGTPAAAGRAVRAVGVGAAGFIDRSRTTVMFAPNLAWRDEPLQKRLVDRLGLPVVVENDANAAAWGEYRFGAGQGAATLVMVTVGTGIGGGLVIGGQLVRGGFGVAAEFGHLRVIPCGRRCGCGQRGCWEQYCSGRALARDAADLVAADPGAAAGLLAQCDGDPRTLTGEQVTAAAAAGDAVALAAVGQVADWLGVGLATLAATLDPDVIVVGGGLGAVGELLLAPARESFQRAMPGAGHRPLARLVSADLGAHAGLCGAADLALRG